MISALALSCLYATPIIIAAIGGLFCERSGVTNIALEGIMLVGAFVAAVVTYYLGVDANLNSVYGKMIPFIACIVAGVAGIIFSIVHAIASIRYKADQIISGTAVNMLAAGFTVFMSKVLFDQQRTPNYEVGFSKLDFGFLNNIPLLNKLDDIPVLGNIINGIGEFCESLYPPFIFTIILVVVTAFVVKKTRFGLRLRACGEYPQAAASMGINVYKTRYIAVLLSGLFGGIAGATMVLTVDTQFSATVIHGFGFIAIATLIFGKWNAWGVLGAGLFFGLSNMFAINSTSFNFLKGIPTDFFYMIPYILTVIALVVTANKSSGPKAIGEIYDEGKR